MRPAGSVGRMEHPGQASPPDPAPAGTPAGPGGAGRDGTAHPTRTAVRARARRAGGAVLLWAALALPAVAAEALGLTEPAGPWARAAGLAVLAASAALARHRPLAAFALTAALGLATAPALFTVGHGPALAVLALLLGLRAPRARPRRRASPRRPPWAPRGSRRPAPTRPPSCWC